MTEKPERPASLARRRPRPAPDEHIDPVDYTPPTRYLTPARDTDGVDTASAGNPGGRAHGRAQARAGPAAPGTHDPARGAGGPGRLRPDRRAHRARLTEHDGTARAVIENAVRAYAQQLNR